MAAESNESSNGDKGFQDRGLFCKQWSCLSLFPEGVGDGGLEGGEGGAMAHLSALIFFHGVVAWRGLSTPR